jgi:hypothetical protein
VPVINTLEAVTLANVGLNPFAMFEANDAVVANEELIDALTLFITLVNVFPSPLVNVIVSLLLDAVRTLFNANEALVANDAVPNKLPVNPKVAVTEPVTIWLPINVFEPVVATEPVNKLNELVVTTELVKALNELVVTTELVNALNELVVTNPDTSIGVEPEIIYNVLAFGEPIALYSACVNVTTC